jgi:hypothetical protein
MLYVTKLCHGEVNLLHALSYALSETQALRHPKSWIPLIVIYTEHIYTRATNEGPVAWTLCIFFGRVSLSFFPGYIHDSSSEALGR